MLMYDENCIFLKECTMLVAVRFTRIGRDMSFSATQADAPGGSLMYEMHWGEILMAGYVVMKFLDFRKAVQLQKVRRNGKAMIEILITRPDEYERLCDQMPRYRLRGTSGTGYGTTRVGTWWSWWTFECIGR